MMPSLTPFYVVTGATGSIGREIVKALLSQGKAVVLAARNEPKMSALRDSLLTLFPRADIRMLPLDLASEQSVDSAPSRLRQLLTDFIVTPDGHPLSFTQPVEALINNAGVMNRLYSADARGRELTMAVNYANTRRLTLALAPMIEDGGAVVFTTSLTRFWGRRHNYPVEFTPHTYGQMKAYASSKKALTDFAKTFAAENPRLRVNCADPGIVNTGIITMHRWYDPLANIFFRPFIRSPRQGAQPALRALQAPDSGKIYCRRRTHSI